MTILDYIKPIENITEIQKSELEIQFKIKTLEIDKKIIDVQEKKNMLLDELKLACDGINHYISSDLKNIKLDSIINENNKLWDNDLNNINKEISKLENDKKFLNDLFNVLVGNTVKGFVRNVNNLYLGLEDFNDLKDMGITIENHTLNDDETVNDYKLLWEKYYKGLRKFNYIHFKITKKQYNTSDIDYIHKKIFDFLNVSITGSKIFSSFNLTNPSSFQSYAYYGDINIFHTPEDPYSPYIYIKHIQCYEDRYGTNLLNG